jgi:MarR family transcriptional regulator, 2-MHQ and catechol-resistance regulon repressor
MDEQQEKRALKTYLKLLRAADSVSARVHLHLAGARLSLSQFGVLEALLHLGPLHQNELGRKLLKSSGNITMVVDHLEQRGLVLRERDAEDRRRVTVQLTAAGRKLINLVFPRHLEMIHAAMQPLDGEELEALGGLCRKLGLAAGKPQFKLPRSNGVPVERM